MSQGGPSCGGRERATEVSHRVYRVLMRAYPRDIRERYGEEMVGCFSDVCRDEVRNSGARGLAAVWIRTLPDLTFTALKERSTTLNRSTYRSVGGVALATVLVLLVPLLAMQITDEVIWTLADFIFAGALFFGAGLMYVLVVRKAGNIAYRAAIAVTLAAAFLLVWVNAAVGITDSDADLMYVGVIAIGIIGSIIARLRPHGMARALFATALAQALVAMIALIGGMVPAYNSAFEILGITGFYVALFVGAALLFRYAGREQTPVAPTGAEPES